MNIRDCYRILEITPDTSLDDMHQAYRDLATVWHPDKYANNPRLRHKAETKLKQINMAYDMLMQSISESGQTSKEHEHKAQEEMQRQEQGRAKHGREKSGRRNITKRGSLTVLKFPSRLLWWCR